MCFVRAKVKDKNRDIAYKKYVTDMLVPIVEHLDKEVLCSWYDIAFGENIPTIEDERQKALDAFARG